MSEFLTVDGFRELAEKERRVERVDLPNGSHVFVRELSAKEAGPVDSAMRGDWGDVTVQIVMLATCDENARRIFTEDDLEMIGEIGRGNLTPIAAAALRVSGSATDAAKKNDSENESDGS